MSGRGSEDSEAPKGPTGGGPTVNGSIEAMLTPELLFRMNKKIAQLTKVVYGLNTRGEELETQLTAAREAEDSARTSSTELQHRLSHYKTKYESELGRLRDLETQAGQAHYWKIECENLKRRLDLEAGLAGGGGSSIEVRAAVSAARDEADRAIRREQAAAYELDQARQAIISLKGHHDFIMRERDAQEAMEREKMELEWQTRVAEMENRYKSQIRHVTDDMEVLAAECEILRRRAADSGSGENVLRDQLMAMERDHDRHRREWEHTRQRLEREVEEEKLTASQEKRECDARIRSMNDQRRHLDEEWEDKMRDQTRESESKLREANERLELMQRLIDDQEEEFEMRLKSKVVEWKTEWDSVEEGLKDEIRKLKHENDSVKSDVTVNRSRLERANVEYEMKIQELQAEVTNKTNELESTTRNLRTRLTAIDQANRQQGQEKNEAERHMREEKERFRQLSRKFEITERVKNELEQKVKKLGDSERQLQERVSLLTIENEEVKSEMQELKTKIQTKEREWTAKLETDSKASETRTKQRIEKTWLEKLRRSEEIAAQDMERLKESQRRSEADLRKELILAKKAEEEAKRLNEEFKKKVRTLRQGEADYAHKISELDDTVQELRRQQGPVVSAGPKELAAQEERYQKQVDHLTLTLAQSQEEVSKLNNTIEDLQDAKEALKKAEELEEKLSLLQQDVRDRNAQLDFARSEVQGTKNEMEITKGKLKKLEEDLDAAKQKNQALQNQITATANCDRTEELEGKIRDIQETLKHTEEARDKLTKTIEEIETERDDEVKIIQEALDEAAQEREDLINTFEKEFQNMTTMNSTREQQLMEDFEWKLREMEKEHKKKLEEHDKRAENTLHRVKRQAEEAEAEFKQKQEKMKNELNAEWEDKLRSECSRLKSELDELHAEEKHLAVESMKVQKEQEIRTLKQTWEKRQEETTKEISKLKDSLTEKDAYYHKEMENQRTTADRDVWELRRKLQRLDEKNWSQQEFLQEKHQEELERVRMDYKDRVDDLEKRLAVAVEDCNEESRAQANKLHNDEMEHLCQQHRLSMERLREELESEKFQAVEEARVIVSQHLEYINTTLKEQLAEAVTSSTQYRDELEAVRAALAVREEVIVSMEDKLNILKANSSNPNNTSSYKDSQSSLASSSEESGSSGNNSQDRLSFSESMGASIDSQDEAHKSGGSSLLGKVFGGGWFSSTKGKENSRRGSSVPNKTTSS